MEIVATPRINYQAFSFIGSKLPAAKLLTAEPDPQCPSCKQVHAGQPRYCPNTGQNLVLMTPRRTLVAGFHREQGVLRIDGRDYRVLSMSYEFIVGDAREATTHDRTEKIWTDWVVLVGPLVAHSESFCDVRRQQQFQLLDSGPEPALLYAAHQIEDLRADLEKFDLWDPQQFGWWNVMMGDPCTVLPQAPLRLF